MISQKFYATLVQEAHTRESPPVHMGALRADAAEGLGAVSRLAGYQRYLTAARQWKGSRKKTDVRFEREVLAQASRALEDGKALAGVVLRSTRHQRRAGVLDRQLQAWVSAVKAAGPVQIGELWAEVSKDAQVRTALRAEGVTDELFESLDQGMRQFDGQIAERDGRLTAELKLHGSARSQRIVLDRTPSGPPQNLSELLRRGRFDDAVEQFGLGAGLSFGLGNVANGEVEAPEVVLAASAQGLHLLAQHKRKLQDTGLDAYAGKEVVLAIILIAGIVALIVGTILKSWCDDDPDGAACKTGTVLTILGLLAMSIGLIGLGDPFSGFVAGAYFLVELLNAFGADVEISS